VKKYLATLFVAVAFAFSASAATPPAKPVVLNAKNGNVTFNHSKHSTLKCETCHASAEGGKIEGFGKDKAHGTCVECHKKEAAAGKAAPTKCADCHKPA
jgi:Cytochrome c7 and related cytochrome c